MLGDVRHKPGTCRIDHYAAKQLARTMAFRRSGSIRVNVITAGGVELVPPETVVGLVRTAGLRLSAIGLAGSDVEGLRRKTNREVLCDRGGATAHQLQVLLRLLRPLMLG